MKCPHCGIHYDDSERECPMCGAAKPLFGKDKSKLARSTATLAREVEKTDKRDAMSSRLDLGKGKKNKKKKSKMSTGFIVILFVILINAVPIIASVFDSLSERLSEVTPVVPDHEYIDFNYCGVWSTDDGRQIAIIPEDNEISPSKYVVNYDNYTESGEHITYQAFEEDEVWGLVSPVDYYAWIVNIYPESLQTGLGEEIEEERFTDRVSDEMVIYRSIEDESLVYAYDLNSSIPWLEDGTLVKITKTQDEIPAEALLGHI